MLVNWQKFHLTSHSNRNKWQITRENGTNYPQIHSLNCMQSWQYGQISIFCATVLIISNLSVCWHRMIWRDCARLGLRLHCTDMYKTQTFHHYFWDVKCHAWWFCIKILDFYKYTFTFPLGWPYVHLFCFCRVRLSPSVEEKLQTAGLPRYQSLQAKSSNLKLKPPWESRGDLQGDLPYLYLEDLGPYV